jgi:hypothetical protein
LRRERDKAEWLTLPAEGRQGPPPAWPLSRASVRETQWWTRLWAMPQAVAWERANQTIEVAMYVRRLVVAERPKAPVNVGTLVRQMADALGLTIPGLRANRWRIATDEVAAKRDERSEVPSARDRFRVVRDGTGA